MQLAIYASVPPGVVAIPLRRKNGSIRAFAWIDEADARLAERRWYLSPGGYVRANDYPYGKGKPVTVHLHREVLGLSRDDPRAVDHRDHNPLNCRRANLRACTHAENHQNRRAGGDRNSSSRYRGVSWSREHGKWSASAYISGTRHALGYYLTEDEAHAVVAAFRRKNMPYSTN